LRYGIGGKKKNSAEREFLAANYSTEIMASWGAAMGSSIDRRVAVAAGAFEARQSFNIEIFVERYGGTTACSFKAGERLFVQAEPANRIFYVQEGQVQLSVISAHGKEAILGVVGAGDFCGDGGVIAGLIRGATATCITDCVIAKLDRTNITRAIREDAAFAEFFIVCALRRAFGLRDSLLSHLFDSSEIRLARVLLRLADYGKEGQRGTIIKGVDQEALAQMIGTTRSRVNQFMNKFRKLGYIDYDSTIVVYRDRIASLLREDAAASSRSKTPTAA